MGIVEEIRQLIQEGKLEAGLKKLNSWSEENNEDVFGTSILLLSRFNQLRRNIDIGVISSDDADRTRNQITLAVLSTIKEIK